MSKQPSGAPDGALVFFSPIKVPVKVMAAPAIKIGGERTPSDMCIFLCPLLVLFLEKKISPI